MVKKNAQNVYVVDQSDIYQYHAKLNEHNVNYFKSFNILSESIYKTNPAIDALIFEMMCNNGNILTHRALQLKSLYRQKGHNITLVTFTNCSEKLMKKALNYGVDFAISKSRALEADSILESIICSDDKLKLDRLYINIPKPRNTNHITAPIDSKYLFLKGRITIPPLG